MLTITRLSILGTGNQITAGDIQSGGADTFQRGLLVGNNGTGVLTLSGGSLTSNGGSTNPDVLGVIASVGDGTLVINGGSYLNTASTGTLNLGNSQASGTLTVSSGSATIHTLRFHAGTSGSRTRATVNLDGGNLTLSNITVTSGNASKIVSRVPADRNWKTQLGKPDVVIFTGKAQPRAGLFCLVDRA